MENLCSKTDKIYSVRLEQNKVLNLVIFELKKVFVIYIFMPLVHVPNTRNY